jgi:hypothetical protein
MSTAAYRKLVADALEGDAPELERLGAVVESALQAYLPARYVPAITPS